MKWALIPVISAGSLFMSPYYGNLAVSIVVFSLFALSVDLVFGRLGYVTFGHAAFFGLGAYTTALVSIHIGLHLWLAAFLAVIPGAALGALVGFASLRVGGAYFAIASLTTAEILGLVAGNWMDVTRGPMGLVVPAPKFALPSWLQVSDQQCHLALCILVLATVYLGVARLMRHPLGRAWLAVRESNNLAESIGVPSLRARTINLSISGGIGALSGALLVPKILVVSPDLFSPTYSAMGLLMVILGGKGTLLGPLLGGALFTLVPEAFRSIDEYRLAIFAILILLIIRIEPRGVVGLWTRFRRGRGEEHRIDARPDEQAATFDEHNHAGAPAIGRHGPVLAVDDLSRSFVGLKAVSSVSFALHQGEIVGLIGPNGAGKTTTLNLISGFLKPAGGGVSFDGVSLDLLPPHKVAALGLVRTFQQAEIFRDLPALENVIIGTHLMARKSSVLACLLVSRWHRDVERSRRARAFSALHMVGLRDKAHMMAGQLSYGEQRLLAIAIALASKPKLLVLDEPAAGLNHTEAQLLGRLLERLRESGLTIILVEHNLELVMSVTDRIVVLHHGEVISIGTPSEIRADPTVQAAYLGMAPSNNEDELEARLNA